MRRVHPRAAPRTATLKRLVRDLPAGPAPLAERLEPMGLDTVELDEWEAVVDPAGGDLEVFIACAREIADLLHELIPRLVVSSDAARSGRAGLARAHRAARVAGSAERRGRLALRAARARRGGRGGRCGRALRAARARGPRRGRDRRALHGRDARRRQGSQPKCPAVHGREARAGEAVARQRRRAGARGDRRGRGRHRARPLPRSRPDDRNPAGSGVAQPRRHDDRRRRASPSTSA